MYREDFVKRSLANEKSKSALCDEYGISRPTGDKWIKRYLAGETMTDRSRAPFRTPNKIPAEIEQLIVNARKKEPAIGAAKIGRMLENEGQANIPCTSTINAVLKRNHLIERSASLAATPCKRFEKEVSNLMWQTDFKGHFALENGHRCHPLSVIDDHSRFCLFADAKEKEQYAGTRISFENTFREYGLPKVLLCDNGNPWGNSQTTGYTSFEVWMMELGILVIHGRANHPQTQGKIERFNRSYKEERLKFSVPVDMADAQAHRLEYRDFYNKQRPHHALNLDVPASRYHPSQNPFPSKIQDWDYGDAEVRKIKSTGFLTYAGQGYFLSEAVGGKTVCVRPSSVDGFVNIIYRQFKIARISIREKSVVSRRIYLLHDDPRNLNR
jgi:transposase InsO family protein